MSRTPGAAHPQAILGIDLGTTEVKAGLVTLDGRLLALARSGYALDVGRHPGWAEQDPGAWWSAVVSAVRALRVTDVAEVVAIGVDGHGPTLVAVDSRGEATRPAITWMDTRSIAEADELAEATGVRGWALAGLPAALWVERHDRAAAAAAMSFATTFAIGKAACYFLAIHRAGGSDPKGVSKAYAEALAQAFRFRKTAQAQG